MASILQRIEYEREEYCRFDDYARYHKHLTRKLHALRKSSKATAAASSTLNKPSESPQQAWLVPLLSAERVWSAAMESKTAGGKAQVILAKLRKAVKFARAVPSASLSAAAQLEQAAYVDFLTASLHQQRGQVDLSIHFFARSLVALQVLTAQQHKSGKSSGPSASALFEAVETGLRYGLYTAQTTTERNVNLHTFAVEQVTTAATEDAAADEAWRQLVLSVDADALDAPKQGDRAHGASSKTDTLVSQINWAGRTAILKQSTLAASMSTALSGRAAVEPAHDAIIAAWTNTLTTLQTLLDGEEDQDTVQDLELIKAFTRFESGQDYLARDLAMLKTVSAREGVLILDQTLVRLTEAANLPGLSASQTVLLALQQQSVRAERCALLSDVHGVSLEGIALLNRALTYLRTQDRQSVKDADKDEQVTGQLEKQARQAKILEERLHRSSAEYTLVLSSNKSGDHHTTNMTSSTEGVLDPTQWYAGTAQQLAKLDARALVTRSVGAKPIVLDVAWNYLSGAVEEQGQAQAQAEKVQKEAGEAMQVDEEEEEEAMEESAPKQTPKKGLFGSLFGR